MFQWMDRPTLTWNGREEGLTDLQKRFVNEGKATFRNGIFQMRNDKRDLVLREFKTKAEDPDEDSNQR